MYRKSALTKYFLEQCCIIAISYYFKFDEAKLLLEKALTLLTSQEDKDWDLLMKVNRAVAGVLTSLGLENEPEMILARIRTIEETIRS